MGSKLPIRGAGDGVHTGAVQAKRDGRVRHGKTGGDPCAGKGLLLCARR